jgi:hypothetical protein
MGGDTYVQVPLREKSSNQVISQDQRGQYHQEHRNGPRETVWLKAQVHSAPRLANDWLAWSFEDALAEASRLQISSLDAFTVELIDRSQVEDGAYTHSLSLGYFLAR